MSINGHKTSCTRIKYLKKKEKKRYILFSLHLSIKHMNTPPNKNGQILTLPLRMTTLISQNYSPFLSRVTKGKSVK